MFANELTMEHDIKPANNYETIIVTAESLRAVPCLRRRRSAGST